MTHSLPSGNCPNCNAKLKTDYRFCPVCGQKRLTKEDFSIRHFVAHSVVDYFHIDGGFLKSLKYLFFKPGMLTNQYLEGKRNSFLHPIKMLMFITILYFLMVSLGMSLSHSEPADSSAKTEKNVFTLTLGGHQISADSLRYKVGTKGIDHYIDSIDPDAGFLTRKIAKGTALLLIDGYDAMLEKLVHRASKVVFILIPVLALLLQLFYIRRKRLYYDHLIFAIHFHSFLFLMLFLYALIDLFPVNIDILVFISCILIYLYIALYQVYKQSYFKTLLKLLLIFVTYLFVAVPVFFILLLTFSVVF